jgi:hypothetical protein
MKLKANSQRLTTVTQEVGDLSNKLGELENVGDLADGMVGLGYYLSQDPRTDDSNHYYEVKESCILYGDDATFDYDLRGYRVVPGETDVLHFKFGGDSPVDADTLGLEAQDLQIKQPLQVRVVRDDPYFKVFQVNLARALSEGDNFHVRISLRWNNTSPRSRRRDYLFSSWGSFAALGVDHLSFRLSADVDVPSATLEVLSGGHRDRARIQPKITNKDGRCELYWAADNPTDLYLLRFEKSDVE